MRCAYWDNGSLLACLCCACSSGESSSGQETGSAGQAGSAGQNAGGDAGSAGTAGSDGCAIHSDCPPGTLCDDTANECRIGCRVSDDCGPDGQCDENGFCAQATACMADSDCVADVEVCDCRSRCVPIIGNRCRSNLSCETTDYCDDCSGQCRPRSEQCGECRGDDECDPRAVCIRASLPGQSLDDPGYCAASVRGHVM